MYIHLVYGGGLSGLVCGVTIQLRTVVANVAINLSIVDIRLVS